MKYILGRWVWNEVEGWLPPAGAVWVIDLRNLAAQAMPSAVQGYVLFAAKRDPVGEELLIADGAVLDGQALDGVKDLLGIPEALSATTVPELTRLLLGVYSDPSVGLICPPLMPDHRGKMRLNLGELSVSYPTPKSGTEWDNIVKVLQDQYRSVKESGTTNLHRKLLSVWQRKFGIENHEVFIPKDLPKETPVRPTTTIQDNFNVGNHADISGQASSDGWTWSKIEGSAQSLYRTNTGVYAECISVNNLRCGYRADSDLSSTDHYVQAGAIRSQDDDMFMGLFARKDSSATLTFYDVQGRWADEVWRIRKRVSGTFTTLQDNAMTINTATDYLLKFVVDGSTLQSWVDGVQIGTDLTDSAITTGTRCGMTGINIHPTIPNTGRVEDFEAGDLIQLDETVREVVDRSDRAFAQILGSTSPTVREVVTRSDRAEALILGSLSPVVREAVTRTDRTLASFATTFEVSTRDVRFLADRATAGVQVPYSNQMVVLFHIHDYFTDGTFGFSTLPVTGQHNHLAKVINCGASERQIPVPPTGPPRISELVAELDDSRDPVTGIQYFRSTFGARTPKFRKVDYRIGPVGGIEALFQTPFSGVITDVKFPPFKARVQMKDSRDKWLDKLIPTFYNDEIFPNLPPGRRDGFLPYVFGIVSSFGFGEQGAIRLQHVDTVNHRYIVARHPVEAVTRLFRKLPGEAEFTEVSSGWSLVVEEITIDGFRYDFSYVQFPSDQAGAEFRADVDGCNFFGAWGLFPEHSDVSRNVIDHTFSFLYTVERLEQVQINYDIYSFARVREELENRQWHCDIAITEQMTNAAALTRFLGPRLIHWFPSRRDQFYVAMTPEELPVDAPRFGDALHILRESEEIELAQETKNRIFYDFAENQDLGFAGHGKYDNVTDQATLLDDEGNTIFEDETIILHGVRDRDVALEIATEWGVWRDQDAHRAVFEVDMPTNIEQDRVELARDAVITHAGGLADGGWVSERFFIYGVRDEYDRRRFLLYVIRRPAVPALIDQVVEIGQWSWNHLPGPWYVTGNKLTFECYVDDRSGLRKMVMLCPDEDGVMVPVDDGAYPTLDNAILSSGGVRYGNKVYVAHQEQTTGRVAGSIFDLALREWILLNFEFLESNSHGDCGVSPVVRQPSGQFGVMYQGDRGEGTGTMGTFGPGFYMRAKFKYMDDNGDLSAEFDLGEPDTLYATDWFPVWGDPSYLGKVHIRVGRAIAEEENNVRFMISVSEPADASSTQDLYTQILSGSDVLTPTYEFKMTFAGEFVPTFAYGDPCTFNYDNTFFTAVPVSIQNAPRLMIWQSTSAAGAPTYDIPIGATLVSETSPDTFESLQSPFGVRPYPGTAFPGRLIVIIGTRAAGQSDWAVYKTIDPPYTEASPIYTSRADQIGPTWSTNTYARHGFDVAIVRGKLNVFKTTSGNEGLPGLSGYRINERVIVPDDVPGDNGYTVEEFIADHS